MGPVMPAHRALALYAVTKCHACVPSMTAFAGSSNAALVQHDRLQHRPVLTNLHACSSMQNLSGNRAEVAGTLPDSGSTFNCVSSSSGMYAISLHGSNSEYLELLLNTFCAAPTCAPPATQARQSVHATAEGLILLANARRQKLFPGSMTPNHPSGAVLTAHRAKQPGPKK